MKQHVIFTSRFNLSFAEMLTESIPEEQMCDQPGALKNHPAWILGHIGKSCDFAGTQFGLESTFPTAWSDLFNRGSQPTSDRDLYPLKKELLNELRTQHDKLIALVEKIEDEILAQPLEDEIRRAIFPTQGDFLTFVMVVHEAMHLGQLSMWRRAMGFEGVIKDPK